MKRLVFLAALAFPLAALADPAPLPQAFDIRLDRAQLATIEKALVKMPYEDVAPLLENLSKQVHEQAEAAAKTEEKK